MRLTRRQCDFLSNLLELYRSAHQPVHYSHVAEALGVSRFSAYDMLKLLERKGFVKSHYILGPGHNGPGRSSIAFQPTAKARAAVRLFGGRTDASTEWEDVRERILTKLRSRDLADDRLFKDLLAHIPDIKSPLDYCAQSATAFILNLHAIRQRAADLNPFKALPALSPPGQMGLGALAGLSIGSALASGFDQAVLERLLSLARRFQSTLATLSDEHVRHLSALVDEALDMLNQPAATNTRQVDG